MSWTPTVTVLFIYFFLIKLSIFLAKDQSLKETQKGQQKLTMVLMTILLKSSYFVFVYTTIWKW